MKTLLDHLADEFASYRTATVSRSAEFEESAAAEAVEQFVDFAQRYLETHRPVGTFWAERNIGFKLRVDDSPLHRELLLAREPAPPEHRDTSVPVFGVSRGDTAPQAPPSGIGGR